MSEADTTSPAMAPRPEPTWLASIAPTALPSIARMGPPIPAASAGSALPSAPTDEAAIGSTSTFHTSVVPTTHSARLQAAVEVTPDGKSVVSSSQWSARRTASAISSRSRCEGVGSGRLGHGLASGVDGELPVQRAVVGLHHRLDLAEQLVEIGRTTGEELLERRTPERVLVVRRRLVGHASTVRGRRLLDGPSVP